MDKQRRERAMKLNWGRWQRRISKRAKTIIQNVSSEGVNRKEKYEMITRQSLIREYCLIKHIFESKEKYHEVLELIKGLEKDAATEISRLIKEAIGQELASNDVVDITVNGEKFVLTISMK